MSWEGMGKQEIILRQPWLQWYSASIQYTQLGTMNMHVWQDGDGDKSDGTQWSSSIVIFSPYAERFMKHDYAQYGQASPNWRSSGRWRGKIDSGVYLKLGLSQDASVSTLRQSLHSLMGTYEFDSPSFVSKLEPPETYDFILQNIAHCSPQISHPLSTILSIPPLIPAGIQEFRGIPEIPEDSGRNQQESNWNQHRTSLFRLYFVFLFQIYILEQGNWPK